MLVLQRSLGTMRGSIDGAHGGDAASCTTYVNAYNTILCSGVFYDDVPADWQDIDLSYVVSFIYSLDRTRPAYLSCINAGTVDDFNYGLALQAIDLTQQVLNPAVAAAAAKLYRQAAPTRQLALESAPAVGYTMPVGRRTCRQV